MILSPVNYQPYGSKVIEILPKSSCHTPKIFQVFHSYSTKSEEETRWILYLSIFCLRNHPNIRWYIFIYALQATQGQDQMAKGANNRLCKKQMYN